MLGCARNAKGQGGAILCKKEAQGATHGFGLSFSKLLFQATSKTSRGCASALRGMSAARGQVLREAQAVRRVGSPSIPLEEDALYFVCVISLPTGFTWAVVVAQRVHEQFIREAGFRADRYVAAIWPTPNIEEGDVATPIATTSHFRVCAKRPLMRACAAPWMCSPGRASYYVMLYGLRLPPLRLAVRLMELVSRLVPGLTGRVGSGGLVSGRPAGFGFPRSRLNTLEAFCFRSAVEPTLPLCVPGCLRVSARCA
jgi:hypothetical protein